MTSSVSPVLVAEMRIAVVTPTVERRCLLVTPLAATIGAEECHWCRAGQVVVHASMGKREGLTEREGIKRGNNTSLARQNHYDMVPEAPTSNKTLRPKDAPLCYTPPQILILLITCDPNEH